MRKELWQDAEGYGSFPLHRELTGAAQLTEGPRWPHSHVWDLVLAVGWGSPLQASNSTWFVILQGLSLHVASSPAGVRASLYED